MRILSAMLFGIVLGGILVYTLQPRNANSSQFIDGTVVVQVLHGPHLQPLTGQTKIIIWDANWKAMPAQARPTLLGMANRNGAFRSTFRIPADDVPKPLLDYFVAQLRPKYQDPGL